MGEMNDLELLLDLVRRLGTTTNLPDLLDQIVAATRQVLHCERASVFLHDALNDQLVSRAATGEQTIRFPSGHGIAGEAFRSRGVINVADAYADSRFCPDVDRATGFRTCSILTCPLFSHDDRPIGVLQALNKICGCFDARDEWLILTLGAQTGAAVQRQMLLEELRRKQRMDEDLEIARGIQQQLLPSNPPTVEGFELAGWNRPADATGGDFYDWLSFEDGSIALVLADASGHGIGPALVMMECRALLRGALAVDRHLTRVLDWVNRLLCQDLTDGRFVTCLAAVLEPATGKLRYISAGQGPLLHYRAQSGTVEQLRVSGCPLGILEDCPYGEAMEFILQPGDMLVLLTDGFYEATNAANEVYGVERVSRFVCAHAGVEPGRLIAELEREVRAYSEGQEVKDDWTALVLRRQ